MSINKKILASGLGLSLIFCMSSMSLATTGTVNTETVRVRREASTDSDIILNLDQDNTVEVLGDEGEWYRVKSGDSTGYIHKDYLTVSEPAQESVPQENTEVVEATSEEKVEENKQEEKKEVKIIGNKLNSDSGLYLLPAYSSSKIGSVSSGKEIKILKVMNNWSKVEVDGKEAWIPNSKLVETAVQETKPEETTEEEQPEEAENEKTEINKSGYVNIESANLRKGPSTSYESVAGLVENETLLIISEVDGWYEVRTTDNMNGYVSKSLVTIGQPVTSRSYVDRKRIAEEKAAQEAEAAVAAEASTPVSAAPSADTGDIVSTAQQYLGYSYVYGGSSPSTGFDCSGFTSYVYSACGKSISRTSYSQANDGVAVSDLQPGDLLLFNNGGGGSIGHVGIYVGDGSFIHASNPTGGVKYDTINSGYYATYYAGARRIY